MKTNELKLNLQKIALLQAKSTLQRGGIHEDHKNYACVLYEMQFCIYEQLKKTHEID